VVSPPRENSVDSRHEPRLPASLVLSVGASFAGEADD
jgi:hypothetical protein